MSDVDDSGHIIAQHKMDIHQIKSGLTPFERGDILVAKITPCFENGKGANTKTLQTETGFGSTEFHVLRNKKDGDFIFLPHHFSLFSAKVRTRNDWVRRAETRSS